MKGDKVRHITYERQLMRDKLSTQAFGCMSDFGLSYACTWLTQKKIYKYQLSSLLHFFLVLFCICLKNYNFNIKLKYIK